METNMIGEKIAVARKKISYSQAELAQQLFISPQAVGKWERGESVPDLLTTTKLAKVLGVDLNYFAGENSVPPADAKPAAPIVSTDSPAAPKGNEKLTWNMSRGNWVDADLSGLKGLHDKFTSSNIQRCKFVGAEMNGVLLKDNNIEACDFSASQISNGRFDNSHMVDNNFTDCLLNNTAFDNCHIKNCEFSGADLSGGVFKGCSLQKITFEGSVLDRACFTDTHLADVLFSTTLKNCVFENSALSKVTFQNATLLNTFFKCKTLKSVRFINTSADRITYEFLKNARADVSGISLVGE
ncbi:pentapeptide repeat-containing protein [Mucilaginibacter myungsuensis]|uniref:Pentapeptide repeat-containing protein n=1 Tax=Mucilaginibacter myungsuensis TaxID=649104 RepID=A0A929KXC6_9SPHI|nr:pentapeptide repeat-containing protein [Mucilaginibacter myungsuensis]MBE9662215.1 pentapeptide repeat-containing protein [Mucilaginibacter myungsuensis]MDN3599351.1 pentapeptide repeat-containing protein [Mucilaginibacter myungsuensis]